MSDLARFRSDRAGKWSAGVWDGLIEAITARLAPLEEQLNIQRSVTEAIVARGLAVIEAELAPLVTSAEGKISEIDQLKADALIALGIIQAMEEIGIPTANVVGLDAALTGRLLKTENLNDLPDKATARSNLGANNAANLTAGTLPEARLPSRLSAANIYASPALTGAPTAPTAAPGTNTTQLSTTEFVQAALAALVASSPAALDTLNELAAALGNDANFATTMNTALAARLVRANNLSDLTNAVTARANLGMSEAILDARYAQREEGDWTPVLTGASGGTQTPSSATGIYAAAGGIVLAMFDIAAGTWTVTPTGQPIISGLPFVAVPNLIGGGAFGIISGPTNIPANFGGWGLRLLGASFGIVYTNTSSGALVNANSNILTTGTRFSGTYLYRRAV